MASDDAGGNTAPVREINPKTGRIKLADDEELPPEAPGWANYNYDESKHTTGLRWFQRLVVLGLSLFMLYMFLGDQIKTVFHLN
jgi:hypothetical protein